MNAAVDETQPSLSLHESYQRIVVRRAVVLGAVVFVLIASAILDIVTGPSDLTAMQALAGLFNPSALTDIQRLILWDYRLPFALMAILVGGSLGLAGAEMQTVLNNPLASPYTLGISSAATLGASLAITLDLSSFGIPATYIVPVTAFIFALVATLSVQAAGRYVGGGVDSLVLLGIATVFLCNALVALVQFTSEAAAVQQIVFWTIGSLARASWAKVAVVFLTVAVITPFSLRTVWALTVMRAGEEQAQNAGVDVPRLRLMVLLRVSLLAAVAVSFVGAIGFIGLVAPHIARLLLGEDHRFYLPGSLLIGATLLSLASLASKSIMPGIILPAGIVTALIGIPLFIVLTLLQRRRR